MIFMILLTLSGSPVTVTSEETVFVHEWGVVSIDEVIPMAQGAQQGYLDDHGMLQPYSSMAVDAPVIWFHGPEFTGTLTVEVQNGYFSLLIPNPAAISTNDESLPVFPNEENYVAVWKDLVFTDAVSISSDRPYDRRGVFDDSTEGFLWAMPFWREVPALTVTYGAASYTDRFIYYECSASNLFDEQEPSESYQRRSLVFHSEEGELKADLVVAPGNRISIELAVSDEGILEVFSEWGNDNFLEEEIEALWKTWKPSILTRCVQDGEVIVLFPLTDEQVESISTIDLQIDQGYVVEYSRLFLAMGR
jgi:hypothetical protein